MITKQRTSVGKKFWGCGTRHGPSLVRWVDAVSPCWWATEHRVVTISCSIRWYLWYIHLAVVNNKNYFISTRFLLTLNVGKENYLLQLTRIFLDCWKRNDCVRQGLLMSYQNKSGKEMLYILIMIGVALPALASEFWYGKRWQQDKWESPPKISMQ